MIKFALAGNPNCGKTTLFNVLTGSTAHVGNWPGVTVDKREGVYKKLEEPISIVDLPGIYSLSPYTPEEVVSRNFILDEKPDCVINIVDATNLERNLYLTTQIMEIDVPMVIALNMMDAVEKNGDKIDAKSLEKKIGMPVVQISALKGEGMDELMQRAYEESKTPREGCSVLQGSALSHLIGDVKISLQAKGVDAPLFHAVKLVELDELETEAHKDCVKLVEDFKATFNDELFGNDFEAMVADGRYKYISQNFSTVVTHSVPRDMNSLTRSDKIDRVLTHRIWGIPMFLVILFGIFHLTFSEDFFFLNTIFGLPDLESLGLLNAEGGYKNFGVALLSTVYDGAVFAPGVVFTNLLGLLTDAISGWVAGLLSSAPAWVGGFLVDGALGGLFAVIGFLPQILCLFLLFSILEDSGYMARVAFILDRLFRRFGLSGRAFMPMIMGFGCSVPAMINTRTLADDNERTATVRVIPFFSCGAKLPILSAISGAIVATGYNISPDLITYSMYVLGMVVAVVTVLLMRSTTIRGEVPPFIMELPTYHAPLFKSLMLHLWDKAKHFIQKAFTVILASTIVIWFLSHFSFGWQFLGEEQLGDSILASLGKLITPLLTPMGFGSQLGEFGWVFAVAAITGLIAKENVVATFGALAAIVSVGAVAETDVGYATAIIQATGITLPACLAFIVFNMTTIPCFAAVATAKAELPKGKFGWTILFWLCTSYVVATMVYVIGTWWWTAFIFAGVIAVVWIAIAMYNKSKKVA